MSHLRDNPLGSACREYRYGSGYFHLYANARACPKGATEPYTATIEMEDGKYSADTAVLSTRRSSSKLTAVVTSVETY